METGNSPLRSTGTDRLAAPNEALRELLDRMDRLIGLTSWLQVDQVKKLQFKHEKPLSRIADRLATLSGALEDRIASDATVKDMETPALPLEAFTERVSNFERTLALLTTERAVIEAHHLETMVELLDSMEGLLFSGAPVRSAD